MDSFISIIEVSRFLGVSKATVWRLVSRPEASFPQPVRLAGCRATRWRQSEIESWREAQQ